MLIIEALAEKKVFVLGLGRSGRAACRSLAASGAEIIAWDDNEAARRRGETDGLTLCNPIGAGCFDGVQSLVVSPGVPHLYPQQHEAISIALEAGVPLDNDIGIFFASARCRGAKLRRDTPRIVAVTGSNGKSTTAALINHILEAAGRNSQLAGNIGKPVLDMGPIDDCAVLEISSYQAEVAACLEPDVAVLLNFSPDHLDRHGGIGGYFAAKTRLFAGRSLGHAVVSVDEPEGRYLAAWLDGRAGDACVTRISHFAPTNCFGDWVISHDGRLTALRRGDRIAEIDLSGAPHLQGPHNAQNAAAAYAACRCMDLEPETIERALATFTGLAHRMQILGAIGGIRCVNDSKATNCESAAMALKSFRNIRWIAGGQGKEGGISSLAGKLGNVIKAYLIGRSATEFAAQLGNLEHAICGDMASAVKAAVSDAAPEDTILLSPAAASFDQYPDFEERGEHFERELRMRLGTPGCTAA